VARKWPRWMDTHVRIVSGTLIGYCFTDLIIDLVQRSVPSTHAIKSETGDLPRELVVDRYWEADYGR
jgi:hypothetical protein